MCQNQKNTTTESGIILAVISAAVDAYLEKPAAQVSVSKWALAGRQELMEIERD